MLQPALVLPLGALCPQLGLLLVLQPVHLRPVQQLAAPLRVQVGQRADQLLGLGQRRRVVAARAQRRVRQRVLRALLPQLPGVRDLLGGPASGRPLGLQRFQHLGLHRSALRRVGQVVALPLLQALRQPRADLALLPLDHRATQAAGQVAVELQQLGLRAGAGDLAHRGQAFARQLAAALAPHLLCLVSRDRAGVHLLADLVVQLAQALLGALQLQQVLLLCGGFLHLLLVLELGQALPGFLGHQVGARVAQGRADASQGARRCVRQLRTDGHGATRLHAGLGAGDGRHLSSSSCSCRSPGPGLAGCSSPVRWHASPMPACPAQPRSAACRRPAGWRRGALAGQRFG